MVSKFMNFPGPKKGKGRMVIKRPASLKTQSWKQVPYVRGNHAVPARGVRREQAHWRRVVPELLKASDIDIVKMLIHDKILPDWSGKRCPKCNRGTLSTLQTHCNEAKPKYRCSSKACQQRIHPQYLHPLFHAGRGPEALSLQTQSALLLLVILRVPLASIHLILGVNQKVVEAMHKNLQLVRKKYVVQKEKGIKFGASGKWSDVEGDEATFDKRDVLSDAAWEHEVKADRSMLWEQWCGLVKRGKPQTLVLARLSPTLTATRSPGPGPITKQDWGPLGKKWLANRSVIFHTDSAKAYKMKLPGVLHDSVVHQKKRVKKNGKWEWTTTSCLGERPWRWNVAPSTLTAAGNLLRNVCRKGRTFVLAWAACKPKFVLPSMSIGTGGTTCGCAQENSCPLTCLRLWFLRLERLCARTSPVRKKLLLCRRTCAWFLPSLCELHSQYWLEIYGSSLPMIMQVYWMMIEDYSPPMTSEVLTSGLMTEVCSPPMTSEVPTSGLMTEVCSPPMTSEVPTSGLMTEVCSPPMTSEVPTSGLMTEVCSPPMPSEVPTSGLMTEVCSPPMTSEVPTSGLMTEVCSPPMTSEVPTSGLMTEVCSPPMTSEFSMCGLMTKYYHHSSTAGILRPFQTHKKGRLFRGG